MKSSFFPQWKAILGEPASLRRRSVFGVLWVSGASFLTKVSTLARTVVLARLLRPDDFGLFGLAMAANVGFQVFSELGIRAYLIQKSEPEAEEWDTGWTLSVLRGILLFCLLWLSAGVVAAFYARPALTLVLRLLALTTLLSGFNNITLTLLQKRMNFRKKVLLEQSSELLGNAAAIILAILFQSVFALVFGRVAAALSLLAFSYLFFQVRPRFHFEAERIRKVMAFGRGLLVSSAIVFIVTSMDDVVVGKVLGMTMLGFYSMAYGLANLPVTEVARTVGQVAFPAYSEVRDDAGRLERGFAANLTLTSGACVPIAFTLCLLAREVTLVVLGEVWLPMVPALQVLCFLGLFRATATVMGPMLLGCGRSDFLQNIKVAELVVFAVLIYPAVALGGLLGASLFTTSIYVLSLVLHLRYSGLILPSAARVFVRVMWKIVVLSAAGSGLLWAEKTYLVSGETILGLGILLASAGVLYGPFLFHLVATHRPANLSQASA